MIIITLFLLLVLFVVFILLIVVLFLFLFFLLRLWVDAPCLVVLLLLDPGSAELAVPLLYLIYLLLALALKLLYALRMHPPIQWAFLVTITAEIEVALHCSLTDAV